MGTDERICDRIKETRVRAGLSVPQCARVIGWAPNKWVRLEDDASRVWLGELKFIADILGVTVAHLYGEQPMLLPGFKKKKKPAAKDVDPKDVGSGGAVGLGK